jgi:rubrerythrin
MASESTEGAVSVDLPSELHDWLEEKATELGVEREQLLVQLVAAYRTAAEVDDVPAVLGPPDGSTLPADAVADAVDGQVADIVNEQVSDTVEEHVADAIEDQLGGSLDDQIEATVQSILADTLEDQLGSTVRESAEPLVTERVNESTKAVQRQLGDRIDAVEEEFTEKLEDVRERVIQVKKEADAKAPADHTHEQLEAVADLDRSVATLEDELAELRSTVEKAVPEHESKITEVDARIAEMEDRLKTVAWVVSDLRDAHESGKGLEAVERIKRAAAKADIERAKCENCGNKVTLALLTDPTCPHCDATVTNVEPDPGWFRKPKLRVASQLESGDPE